jgi:hypothetical protein
MPHVSGKPFVYIRISGHPDLVAHNGAAAGRIY